MSQETDLYKDIHYVASLDAATEEDVRLIVQSFPIVDNHAHNMLLEQNAYGSLEHPFESITSEAQGDALQNHAHSSLAHIRAINQLAELFHCKPTLDAVKAARSDWIRQDYIGLVKTCLEGTHALLIDDGLSPEAVYPVDWHQPLVPTARRIVRIEFIAAQLLEKLVNDTDITKLGSSASWDRSYSEGLLVYFNTIFRDQIRALALSPGVCGFKSVVCYRTGLDVGVESKNVFSTSSSLAESPLLSAFQDFLLRAIRSGNYRIEQKQVNDFLVVAACEVLEKLAETDESCPIQFHTGLGDADIDLVTANPAYMKPLITAFPTVNFVLLHAAYPFTRQAGYMASTFANAWLDLGEIFGMVSRDGQELAVRHALELSPTSKLLWSTDGHFHPETFYLANRQFRLVLEKILVDYIQAGDISAPQAVNIAVDILFWNSNSLYKLSEETGYPQLLKACGRPPM